MRVWFILKFNSLTHERDWHLIYPYHITPESNIKVRKIKGTLHQQKKLLIVKKISLSAPQETYRKHYGEYTYWCQGAKGYN